MRTYRITLGETVGAGNECPAVNIGEAEIKAPNATMAVYLVRNAVVVKGFDKVEVLGIELVSGGLNDVA